MVTTQTPTEEVSDSPEIPGSRVVHGFMCKIDWDYELGAASDGNKVFPSADALRRAHSSVDACGIVEVAVTLVRVVSEGTGE